jgi:hypothetical protein
MSAAAKRRLTNSPDTINPAHCGLKRPQYAVAYGIDAANHV